MIPATVSARAPTILGGARRIRGYPPMYLPVRLGSTRLHSTSPVQPPDVARLAETARITLSPGEVEEFAPKIRQVIDWFGQLQDVNLENFEPAIRADMEIKSPHMREDSPKTFQNRQAILAAIPSYKEPYIKVPKVLNID